MRGRGVWAPRRNLPVGDALAWSKYINEAL
jgi:hypothetical protein